METSPSRYRPLFLSGEYDAILDDKHRILVPADYRKEVIEAREEKTLVCRIGRNRVAWLYPENYYRELIAQRRTSLMPGEDEEKFNEAYYGMIFRLTWDSQGRIVIPEKIIKRTNMEKNLTLVGAGDHLAVWNREAWERRAQTLLETMDEISDRERQSKAETTATKTQTTTSP
jgi:MraZ protein